jgi:hypothetical protein
VKWLNTEVCKTSIRRFESARRLHLSLRVISASVVIALVAACASPAPSQQGSQALSTPSSPQPSQIVSLPSPAGASSRPAAARAITWKSVRVQVASGERIKGVAASDALFVAVGYRCAKGVTFFCKDPIGEFWTSSDGMSWVLHRVTQPGHLAMVAVAAAPWGFIAIGDVPSSGRWRRIALASPSGNDWREIGSLGQTPASPCTADAEGSPQVFCSASIQVGHELTLFYGSGMAVSADGQQWRMLDPSTVDQWKLPAGGYSLPIMASGPYGLTAITFEADPDQSEYVTAETGRLKFWRSRDGQAWTAGHAEPANGSENTQVELATGFAGGYVAVGWTTGSDASDRPACWTNADGDLWTRHDEGAVHAIALGAALGGVAAIEIDGDTRALNVLTTAGDCHWTPSRVTAPRRGSDPFPIVAGNARQVIIIDTGPDRAGSWLGTVAP